MRYGRLPKYPRPLAPIADRRPNHALPTRNPRLSTVWRNHWRHSGCDSGTRARSFPQHRSTQTGYTTQPWNSLDILHKFHSYATFLSINREISMRVAGVARALLCLFRSNMILRTSITSVSEISLGPSSAVPQVSSVHFNLLSPASLDNDC